MTTEQFYWLIGLNSVLVLLLLSTLYKLRTANQTQKSLNQIILESRLLQDKVVEKNNDIKLYLSNEL